MTLFYKTALLLFFFSLSTSSYGVNDEELLSAIPDEVDMHLQGAGIKNSEGWFLATSRTGRFAIDFPIPYEEWSANLENNTASGLSATSSEGIKFLLLEQPRADNEFKNIRDFAKKFFGKTRRKDTRYFFFNGKKGMQTRVTKQHTSTLYRFFLTKDYIYQLSVEYPKQQRKLALKTSKLFFNSFQF